MAESAPAHGADPAADQRPDAVPPGQPEEPGQPQDLIWPPERSWPEERSWPQKPGWPQEQVAGPRAGGRDAAPAGRGNAVPAGSATERCWLCGARLATYMLMADGGSACPDVRWYCRDTRACTSRWTVQRLRRLESGEPASAP
jgi:hypothetical protein